MVIIVNKGKGLEEKKKKVIFRWLIYSLAYAIVMGILYGTARFYFDTIPLVFGLYMDLSSVFIIFGISGWAIMSFYFKKKYNMKF